MESDELYGGLQALAADAFPKRCPTCGRIYESADDFIAATESVRSGSGLKQSIDDDDQPIVELYRNCVCGSTLMDVFSDRRDLSERGLRRRTRFEQLLKGLEARGIPREKGRAELLTVMRGGRSELLESVIGKRA